MGDTERDDVPPDAPVRRIAPDFPERWGCDTFRAALSRAENSPSTTDYDTFERCPSCLSIKIRRKADHVEMSHKRQTEYKCTAVGCGEHFNEPWPPIAECPVERALRWLDDQQERRDKHIKTMPVNTVFEWCSDLKDPDDRESIIPFADVERERAVELAIRMREPWTDGGPSYDTIAELLPYEDSWVGHRVREWRDGEHRDLVADPSADDGPAADSDPFEYGHVAATDGGREESRWAAYGRE